VYRKKNGLKKIAAAAVLIMLLGIGTSFAHACAAVEPAKSKITKTEDGVSGIVFFRTLKLEQLKNFYIGKVGCKMWMDQGDCIILKFGNMLVGFCQRDSADLDGLITFFYQDKEAVDRAYETFKETAQAAPVMNKKYNIYHFFARDPEGRGIEFQYFAGPIDWDFKKYR
jgi:hypothetical protein